MSMMGSFFDIQRDSKCVFADSAVFKNHPEFCNEWMNKYPVLFTMRAWYDGYVFGDTEIYCPWDVVSYVSALRKRKDAKPKSYWENTSGNDAIKAFLEMGNGSFSDKFEALLNGNTIIEDVTNALTYEEVYGSERNLWSVLLMTGYVTKAKQEESDAADDEEGVREVELRIPNREIAKLFQKTVADHFRNSVDKSHIKELVLALWKGDEETASTVLSDLLFQTISYMDYHEDYYHAFIAGVFAGYGYVPKSNRERGLGRFDVTIKETANRRILFIETKKSDSYERMDFWCDKAIEQIIEKQYAKDVHGSHEVLCYGISFFEKSAKVKLMSNRLKLKRLENDHHL